MTAVSLGVYVLLLAFLAWGPWTLVRSITGDLSGSPLSEGIWCVTAFGLVLAGLVYGSAYFAPGFVTLFFVVQFYAVLDYTGLAAFAGISETWLYWTYTFCCLLAFSVRRK